MLLLKQITVRNIKTIKHLGIIGDSLRGSILLLAYYGITTI